MESIKLSFIVLVIAIIIIFYAFFKTKPSEFDLLMKKAAQGDAKAQYDLGGMYYRVEEMIKKL